MIFLQPAGQTNSKARDGTRKGVLAAPDYKTNLEKRMNAECGACEDKMRLARMAKEQNLDAVHDTVHEMAKDEARHGKGFEGLYKRYFGK